MKYKVVAKDHNPSGIEDFESHEYTNKEEAKFVYDTMILITKEFPIHAKNITITLYGDDEVIESEDFRE